MPNIRSIDMMFLNDLFEMNGGYVLNFSDHTFSAFFAEEIGANIDDPVYAKDGTSKGKRLRCFLQTVDRSTVVKTLRALWEYREALRLRNGTDEKLTKAHERFVEVLRRVDGTATTATTQPSPPPAIDAARIAKLKLDLTDLAQLDAQPRGYAFERFLKDLFDAYKLEARDPFRLKGEQIDGSFQLSKETYLLEAKWQSPPVGADYLRSFNAKVEDKAAWARGLFVSYSGFTSEGLHAFGRGKRVICMDSLDLYDTLHRGLSLSDVLELKVRRAAETGAPFLRVRDLYPG